MPSIKAIHKLPEKRLIVLLFFRFQDLNRTPYIFGLEIQVKVSRTYNVCISKTDHPLLVCMYLDVPANGKFVLLTDIHPRYEYDGDDDEVKYTTTCCLRISSDSFSGNKQTR